MVIYINNQKIIERADRPMAGPFPGPAYQQSKDNRKPKRLELEAPVSDEESTIKR